MRPVLTAFAIALFALFAPPAWAEPDFSPGPDPSRIVLNPAPDPATSQFVTWRTDAATTDGLVEYQPVAGGATNSVNATAGDPITFNGWTYAALPHRAKLTGLKAETAYRYRVGTAGHLSEWSTFKTAASGYRPWTMLYFGDVQRQLDTAWPPVAQMAFDAVPEARVSLFAGDLINKGSEDSDWGYFFAGLGEPARTINQLPVIGNHELTGDGDGSQFEGHFTVPGNGPSDLRSSVYTVDYQGVRFVALDGNRIDLENQASFLKGALSNNPNRWTVVGIHQPVFSGEKGQDYAYIRDAFLPLIKQYNVDLVLQGHDHAYTRGYLAEDLDPATGYVGGPVFADSVAGPMNVELGPADQNSYVDNGAVRKAAYQETATYQPITFDGNRLTYRSVIAGKGAGSNATGQIGDLLDSFTITKLSGGRKVVSEGLEPPDLHEEPKPAKPRLRIGKIVPNRRDGSVRVTVTANVAGTVKATGKAIRPASKRLAAERATTLTLRPGKAATRQLKQGRKVRVKVTFRFRPRSGATRSLSRTIVLARLGSKRAFRSASPAG